MDTKALLARLGIDPLNSGGKGVTWIEKPTGDEIISTNPANGEVLGRVRGVSESEYDRIVGEAAETFKKWRLRLKDQQARALIASRLDRLAYGLAGDVEPVGEGVSELRIHHGPGYRV